MARSPQPESANRPLALLWVCGGVVLLGLAALHLTQGSAEDFGAGDAIAALFAPISGAEVPETHHLFVWWIRVPRLCLAVLAGAALAVAGTVMQACFRNPLASPEIIGTTSGAALGAVVALVAGLQVWSLFAVPLAAFAGAVVVTLLVFAMAGRGARFSVAGLLLAGIAVNTLAGSLVAFVTTLSFGDYRQSAAVLYWLMGGLEKTTWQAVMSTAVGVGLFGALLVPWFRDMDLLTLRDDSAEALGLDAVRRRRMLVFTACGLTASAVANTGGIAFVGLVVPHMTRLVVGPTHRRLVPAAALMGGLVLLAADVICRLTPSEADLRLGVVTSLLGAPFFLVLLRRHRHGEAL